MAIILHITPNMITPDLMAEAFWSMSSGKQAEFFTKLAEVINNDHANGNRGAYGLGEMQWFYLANDLSVPLERRKPGTSYLTPAGHMLQAMAAPLFLHTLRAAEQSRGW